MLLILGLLFAAGAQAAPIYYDNFDGSSSVYLHSTEPDTRPGDETWIASIRWKADGSTTWTTAWSHNAFLPFSPESNNVYRIEAQLSHLGNGDMYLGLLTTNYTSIYFGHALNGMSLFTRLHGTVYDATTAPTNIWSGATRSGTDVSHGSNYGSSPVLAMELDTREALWSAEWFINGASVRTYDYTANPTVYYVGFGINTLDPGEPTYTSHVAYFSLSTKSPSGTVLSVR